MNNKDKNKKQNRLIFKEKQSHVINNKDHIDNNDVVHNDNIIHATHVIENNEISDINVSVVEISDIQTSNSDTDEIEMKKGIENDNDDRDKINNDHVVIGGNIMKADTDVNVDGDDDGGEIVGSVDLNNEHPSTDVEVTSIEINNSTNNKEEIDNNSVVDNHNDDNDDNQSETKNIRNDNDYDHVKTSITENDGIITIDESKTTIDDGDEINSVEIA